MEGLLHWDFNPGLAVVDEVRRRFGETVHFSPSRKSKEFFLVVSFSSTSFPLSEDSVGVALQCCIGGHPKGFKVSRICDSSFRFSMAGNKVGHFIHGLKDRIWPDFICHFHLYKGGSARVYTSNDTRHADEELPELSGQRPIAIQSKLGSTNPTCVSNSMQQLAKFNLVPLSFMWFSNKDSGEASTSAIGNDQ